MGVSASDKQRVEPDYRYSLANERTFLAWIRTGLGLIAGGIAVEQFATLSEGWIEKAIGVIGVVLGGVLAGWALWHWRRVQRTMELDEPLPAQPAAPMLAVGIVVIAGLLAAGILLP